MFPHFPERIRIVKYVGRPRPRAPDAKTQTSDTRRWDLTRRTNYSGPESLEPSKTSQGMSTEALSSCKNGYPFSIQSTSTQQGRGSNKTLAEEILASTSQRQQGYSLTLQRRFSKQATSCNGRISKTLHRSETNCHHKGSCPTSKKERQQR